MGRIHKILKFSAVDGPGNRSVIFLQGCNFDCVYCHNPETIPFNSSDSMEMSPHDVFDYIGNAACFIRGITVSGGEAMLQKKFVTELFTLAKSKNLSTFIDTNGSVDFSAEPELLSVTDSVMLDIKSMNINEHKTLTGQDNTIVLKNLKYLAFASKLFEVRTVVSPNMFDCISTIESVSKFISRFESIRYKIIKYRPIGVRKEHCIYKVPNPAFLKELEQIAKNNGVKDVVII